MLYPEERAQGAGSAPATPPDSAAGSPSFQHVRRDEVMGTHEWDSLLLHVGDPDGVQLSPSLLLLSNRVDQDEPAAGVNDGDKDDDDDDDDDDASIGVSVQRDFARAVGAQDPWHDVVFVVPAGVGSPKVAATLDEAADCSDSVDTEGDEVHVVDEDDDFKDLRVHDDSMGEGCQQGDAAASTTPEAQGGTSWVELPAHRCILALRSRYFQQMFTSGMRESHAGRQRVVIPDHGATEFVLFLRFLYTGETLLPRDPHVVFPLLSLADKYGAVPLRDRCTSYLESQVTTRNACTLLELAYAHRCDELRESCMDVVRRRTAIVLVSDAFVRLSACVLTIILQDEMLSCAEWDVYRAVRRWHVANEHVKDSSLWSWVKFGLLSAGDLRQVEKDGQAPKSLLYEAFRHVACASLPVNLRPPPTFRTQPRCGSAHQEFDASFACEHIVISESQRVATNHGADGEGVANVFLVHGYTTGVHRWAVEWLPSRTEHAKPLLMIGVAARHASLFEGRTSDKGIHDAHVSHVGAKHGLGWGYQSYGSYAYHRGVHSRYGERFGPGDVIGVTLDMDTHKVSFSKNGTQYGTAFFGLPKGSPLFPAFSLWPGVSIRLVKTDDDFV